MVDCLVCKKDGVCCPSPFVPGSYPRCKECVKSHRVWYEDLIIAGTNENYYKCLGEDYFAKYKKATLEFLGISEAEYNQNVERKREELTRL